MLRIDSNMIWVFINLVIFIVVVWVILFRPVLNVIDKRKKMIDDQFATADRVNAEAADLKKKYEDSLSGAKEESVQIVQDAQKRGENQYQKIIGDAQIKATQLLKDANLDVEREREQAIKDAQDEIGKLAMQAATKIVAGANKDKTDAEIYNEFLSQTEE